MEIGTKMAVIKLCKAKKFNGEAVPLEIHVRFGGGTENLVMYFTHLPKATSEDPQPVRVNIADVIPEFPRQQKLSWDACYEVGRRLVDHFEEINSYSLQTKTWFVSS